MGRHECRDTTGGVGVLYNVPCSVNNSMEMEYGIWNMEYATIVSWKNNLGIETTPYNRKKRLWSNGILWIKSEI